MPTTTPFNNLITFSRGSNATVTGSNGLIQWAPNNLLLNSESFNAASWTKSSTGTGVAPTVTPNAAAAPDGTTTADLVVFNRGAGNAIGDRSWLFQTTVVANASPYAASIYIKAATALDIGKQIAFRGVVGVAYQIITLTDSWVQISSVETSNSTSGSIELASRGTVSADNQVSVHIWGAQLELGSEATTYNPTTVKNLLGFSEAFDNAGWTKNAASIVTGAQANPINGAFNAQKLMEDTANAQHRVSQSVTLAAAPHTLSAYLKAGERSWVLMVNGTIANCFTYFNLSTGVVGSVGAGVTSASITAVGGGWYRCAITFTAPAGGNAFEFRTASANGTGSYTGDGNSGVYIYGAQLSDSASLDPYVPTPGAAPSSTAFYGPRFDYDPVTLQPKGLLVEEARTNSCLRSEEIDNATWTKVGVTATANTTTSPDGTVDADSIVASGGSAQHYINQSFSFTSGTAYTLSVFAKKNTLNGVQLTFGSGAFGTLPYANFDLNAGTSFTSNCTATLTNFGDGWYRCTMTATANGTTSAGGVIALARDNAEARLATFSSDGNGIFAYGAQLEAGAFATSYIPTVASTVTRSTDIVAINGSLFSQWYGQSEGTFISDATTSGDVVSSYNLTALNSVSNSIVGFDIDASGVYRLRVTDTAVNQALVQAVAVTSANTTYKIAGAYRTNDFAASANGGTVATDTSGTVPSSMVSFAIGSGSTATGAISWNGHIRSINYVPARAADFQLQALTELPLVPTLDLDFLNNLYEA